MKKPIKQISTERANKNRLLMIFIYNITLGMVLIVTNSVIFDYISLELWHKIISFAGLNIPIAMITMVLFLTIATLLSYSIIRLDYNIYKLGIRYIKIEGEIIE